MIFDRVLHVGRHSWPGVNEANQVNEVEVDAVQVRVALSPKISGGTSQNRSARSRPFSHSPS